KEGYTKNAGQWGQSSGQFCSRCGAWHGQLGLEPNLDLYLKHLLQITAELKRVLKKTGTMWWNHGDCYGGSGCGTNDYRTEASKSIQGIGKNANLYKTGGITRGFKPKCLALQNWRLVIAMIDQQGWILRNANIWRKTNPMPSSVKDRFTNVYEPVFFFTKSRKYWFDLDAVREPCKPDHWRQRHPDWQQRKTNYKKNRFEPMSNIRYRKEGEKLPENYALGKNPGDVWSISTQPFSEAHFACVDRLTEALTPYGWKKWNELKEGDLICAYDKELDVLRWEKIEMIATYNVDTELLHIGKRDLDILTTLNHRTLVKKRNGEIKVIKAENIAYSDKIPVSAYWEEDTYNSCNWAYWELIGWFLSEGAIKKDGSVEIYQSKPEGVKRIKYLLDQNEIEYSIYQKKKKRGNFIEFTFYIPKKEVQLLGWKKKEIKNEWLNLDTETLNSLFWGLVGGDGHIRKDDGRICFIQKDKEFIDKFQIIAIRLGFHCMVSQRKDGKYCAYVTKKKWIGVRGTNGKGKNIKRVRYERLVWCPKVASTFWLARRNGKSFITGNTFPEELVKKCLLPGCPKNRPGIVLDPFAGAGTTLFMAKKYGYNFIGIDINPEYCEMAQKRIDSISDLLI
ncbi:MAG: hypothetical protein J7L46_05515, partial [Bacteroidales bacterium]|nr:hypothetical protein [Bacteroidales bacterium]